MMTDSKSTTVRSLDRINLRLAGDTFAAIDSDRVARPGNVSRNTWIAEAIEEVQAVEPVIESPVTAQVAAFEAHPPAAVTHLVEEPVASTPTWVADDVTEAPALLAPPNGTSRWDPIPTLRPTDSGWRREQDLAAAATRDQARSNEDWNWTTRDADRRKASGDQHWEGERLESEQEEPALSRPWGLLSRFQQTHQITPKRPSGSWRHAEDADADQARETPGSFGADRRG